MLDETFEHSQVYLPKSVNRTKNKHHCKTKTLVFSLRILYHLTLLLRMYLVFKIILIDHLMIQKQNRLKKKYIITYN